MMYVWFKPHSLMFNVRHSLDEVVVGEDAFIFVYSVHVETRNILYQMPDATRLWT